MLFGNFISCQTGPLEPDPIPVVIKYTITAEVLGQIGSVSPSTIDVIKGSGASFLLVLPFGYEPAYITVNGVQSSLTSTTYSFFPNSNSKLEFELKKNNLGILIDGYWKISKWEERLLVKTTWVSYVPNVGTYQFLETNRFQHFNSFSVFNSTTLVGDGNYVLTTDSLIIGPAPNGSGGIRNKIIVLKSDSLVLKFIARGPVGLGIDAEIKQTYIH
ncbi:MAG: hypothetical protein WCW54_00785 [Candidatus Paceibacterota bacterium]